jgi:hypothetical protein
LYLRLLLFSCHRVFEAFKLYINDTGDREALLFLPSILAIMSTYCGSSIYL